MHNILLVDFSHSVFGELQQLLRRSNSIYTIGKRVVTATCALSALAEQQFAVVLISTGGCAVAGLWVCHHIRKVSQIPILILGGNDHFQLVRKALVYQVNDYLPGQFNASSILTSLDRLQTRLEPQLTQRNSSSLRSIIQLEGKQMHSAHVIKLIKTYVLDHLHGDITLKKISDMVHFNCAYLGQKFKLEESMSFNDYLLQQRMEKAKLLLTSTTLRIYEVSAEVGYTDTDWFYKKFRAYAGVSPNAYRKKQKTFTA